MKALVTGAEGFVGPHLINFLKKQGIETVGTCLVSKGDLTEMDVTDKDSVLKVIEKVMPDLIFHLAGFSSVGQSFRNPELCMKVNVEGTRNILDAVVKSGLNSKILIVSSAMVYDNPSSEPLKETDPLGGKSPYGRSRIEQETVCREYVKNHRLFIVMTRSFNHTGPGQPDMFVIPSFGKQIALIEKNRQDFIKVGNLDVVRDFTDVRDVVRAYYFLLEKGKNGEVYNVCSGKRYVLKDLLHVLINQSTAQIRLEEDADRMRPSDVPVLVGDNTKLVKATGWNQEISMEQTLKDVLDWFRNELE